MFKLPVRLSTSAISPTAVLLKPVMLALRASVPIAVLPLAVVLLASAASPRGGVEDAGSIVSKRLKTSGGVG